MPAFTNDDLNRLPRDFDQAQGATNDQLRLLRAVANRLGLYDAADAVARLIVDDAMPKAVAVLTAVEVDNDALDALYAEIEALSREGNVITLDAEMSDRIADTLAEVDDEIAMGFVRRVMVDLRVMPTQTEKVIAMSNKLTAQLLAVL